MVNMMEYIESIIADFPEEIVTVQATPSADHLFEVWDTNANESKPLP